MSESSDGRKYRSTESKYKGGAEEGYITYDLEQHTRGGGTTTYPKVKRVYIAGDVKDWQVGDFTKKSGRPAHGVRIAYEQARSGYHRRGFTARRGDRPYTVKPGTVRPTTQRFAQIVDVPPGARNVRFHSGQLPPQYRQALQHVR